MSDDGPSREMNLDEWCHKLGPSHLASRELRTLRAERHGFMETLELLSSEIRYGNDLDGTGPEKTMGSGEPDTCVFCPSHLDAEGYEAEKSQHIGHHSWCPTQIARAALGGKNRWPISIGFARRAIIMAFIQDPDFRHTYLANIACCLMDEQGHETEALDMRVQHVREKAAERILAHLFNPRELDEHTTIWEPEIGDSTLVDIMRKFVRDNKRPIIRVGTDEMKSLLVELDAQRDENDAVRDMARDANAEIIRVQRERDNLKTASVEARKTIDRLNTTIHQLTEKLGDDVAHGGSDPG